MEETSFAVSQQPELEEGSLEEIENLSPATEAFYTSLQSINKDAASLEAAAVAAAAALALTNEELLLAKRAALVYLLFWLYYTQPLPSSVNSSCEREGDSSTRSDLPAAPLPQTICLSIGESRLLSPHFNPS